MPDSLCNALQNVVTASDTILAICQGCGHNDCVFAALRTYAQVLGLSRL